MVSGQLHLRCFYLHGGIFGNRKVDKKPYKKWKPALTIDSYSIIVLYQFARMKNLRTICSNFNYDLLTTKAAILENFHININDFGQPENPIVPSGSGCIFCR